MDGAARSNEEPLRGIDPRLCKQRQKKKKKKLTWLSVTSHDPRIDQFEAIRISRPHPCGFPLAYLIFYVHHFTRVGPVDQGKHILKPFSLDACSLVRVECWIEYGYLYISICFS